MEYKNKTFVVKSHDVHIDTDYVEWLHEIMQRYKQSQIKAAVRVNSEKTRFNWELGRDLVMRKCEERWGSGIVEQVSLDLRKAFPGDGFSATNVWYMKKWYSFYADKLCHTQIGEKLHQLGGEFGASTTEYSNFPRIFGLVPWRHHIEIITKCKDVEEALYYIGKIVQDSWSRNYLIERIKSDDYHRCSPAINNFAEHLALPQRNLAEEITRENYDFGFLSLPNNYRESELEDALCQQLSHFLLELGTGFAFLGRQKEIVVEGRSRRIDLLFYHTKLKAHIVCELKVVPFEPEFVGKLNYYVSAVDELIKNPDDNPTIGLLICSSLNRTDVKWSFRNVSTPLGVATYSNVKEIQKELPTVEQLVQQVEKVKAERGVQGKRNIENQTL